MSRRSNGPVNRPVAAALCLMLAALAVALIATATAQASVYKMVACAANNGTAPYTTATNTISASHPAGIFDFNNWCGGAAATRPVKPPSCASTSTKAPATPASGPTAR